MFEICSDLSKTGLKIYSFCQYSKKAKKWPNGQTILYLANSFKKAKWQPCSIPLFLTSLSLFLSVSVCLSVCLSLLSLSLFLSVSVCLSVCLSVSLLSLSLSLSLPLSVSFSISLFQIRNRSECLNLRPEDCVKPETFALSSMSKVDWCKDCLKRKGQQMKRKNINRLRSVKTILTKILSQSWWWKFYIWIQLLLIHSFWHCYTFLKSLPWFW